MDKQNVNGKGVGNEPIDYAPLNLVGDILKRESWERHMLKWRGRNQNQSVIWGKGKKKLKVGRVGFCILAFNWWDATAPLKLPNMDIT